MSHRREGRPVRRGTVGTVIWSLVTLFVSQVLAAGGPEGLPNAPELPDLYDPAIVDTYNMVAKRPYQINGHVLAPWLIATALTQKVAHVGPPSPDATRNPTGGPSRDLMVVIGYVTDTRDGRIIALTETFAHPSNETRSIRAWVDEGWVRKGKGSGQWGDLMRTETPLSSQEAAKFMEQVYSLIQTGFQQTVKR